MLSIKTLWAITLCLVSKLRQYKLKYLLLVQLEAKKLHKCYYLITKCPRPTIPCPMPSICINGTLRHQDGGCCCIRKYINRWVCYKLTKHLFEMTFKLFHIQHNAKRMKFSTNELQVSLFVSSLQEHLCLHTQLRNLLFFCSNCRSNMWCTNSIPINAGWSIRVSK